MPSLDEEENRKLVRSWVEDVLCKRAADMTDGWMKNVREKAPHYFDEDYIAHHDPTAKGREGLLDRLAMLSSAFSGIDVELVLIFAKEDMVADCLRITGNHTGQFLGVPPSGRRVSWLQNEIFRLKSGRIIEGWVTRDWLGLLQQLGALGGT